MSTSASSVGAESAAAQPFADDASGLLDALFVDRVRLYFKVLFFINLFFAVLRAGLELSGVVPEAMRASSSMSLLGVIMLAATGMVWFALARSRPSMPVAVGIEAIGTLALTAHYGGLVFAAAKGMDRGEQWVALVLATVALVLRSSLIPSHALGTAALGVLVVLGVLLRTHHHLPNLEVLGLVWLGAMGVVVVAVTTVTSATIYGLQREMRAARRLGQYQLERKLGQGAMGQVYLARHAMLQRRTAVKLLTRSTNEQARARFRREVQTASGLTHPNTIEIYDYGRTPEGAFYFAMEYVEGPTLEAVVRVTGPMPARRVLHLLRQAAGSLGEAHRRGLIHRDIKPQNLMLCERGGAHDTLKVLDFGLVRDLASKVEASEGHLTGTPLYLAPEAILEADGFVAESDVYALGAVGYFLLGGRPPFVGGLLDVLSDHLATEPAPLLRSEDVPGLAPLLMRCLSKDPRDRPPTAAALLEALEAAEVSNPWTRQDAELWWAEHRDIVARAGAIGDAGSLGSNDQLSAALGRATASG